MDAKIVLFTLTVKNQADALEFYTKKVGFEKKTDVTPPGGYRWVTVGLKEQDLELALFQLGSAVDPSQKEPSKNWSPGRAPPIVLRVSDVRKIHQELSARGVEFPQPPVDYPWGTVATFTDPDGNLFSINQPPGTWPKK